MSLNIYGLSLWSTTFPKQTGLRLEIHFFNGSCLEKSANPLQILPPEKNENLPFR